MVDRDLKLVEAIKVVYSGCHVAVLLCWFHVLQVSQTLMNILSSQLYLLFQSVHRWLTSSAGGGCGGPKGQRMRNDVIARMRLLKSCRKV